MDYEFCYIRDDRVKKDDASTKHVNVNYRILGESVDGDIFQGSYKREDHFFSPVLGTSPAQMEDTLNIKDLDKSGPIRELYKRGLKLSLGKE